jgi:hypothetical protein
MEILTNLEAFDSLVHIQDIYCCSHDLVYSNKGGSSEYSKNIMHIAHVLEFCQHGKFQLYAACVMTGYITVVMV